MDWDICFNKGKCPFLAWKWAEMEDIYGIYSKGKCSKK